MNALLSTLMTNGCGTAPALMTEPARAALPSSVLDHAQATAARTGIPVLRALLDAYPGQERNLMQQLGGLFDLLVVDTPWLDAATPDFDRVPLVQAMQRGCVLLREAGVAIAVVGDPFDSDLQAWVEARAGGALRLQLALPADIQAYLTKQEMSVRTVDSIVSESTGGATDAKATEVLSFASVNDAASPAVKLLNSTLYDALKLCASDIHLECTPSGLAIKYRIDGVLDLARSIAGRELAEQTLSRLKVLAELDISERRLPQDGSFRVESNGRDVDLRVSIIPGIHGEDAVIRILDKRTMIEAHGALSLETLGFDARSLEQLRRLTSMPYGMLLVTGPTGSGKTTTLYAALTEVNHGRDKIITIEDPVEYQLPGILQIPVNDKKGLTFARGLRSILRHDPDKIMVGEIRDRETAEIAVQSALTGHLVLTTVHANNVFDVFGRFTHMGIDPYAMVSALNGVWAQRLVRNNCRHCARPVPVDLALARVLGVDERQLGDGLMAGSGCGDCRGSGYRGRTAVAEILALDDELRELIVERAPVRQIKEVAARHGTRTLREVALELVRAGTTTLEEVRRVTLQS